MFKYLKIPILRYRAGQSIIEILIAVTIGGLIIGSAVVAIRLTLTSGSQTQGVGSATPLMSGLIDTARSVAEGNWNSVYNLPSKGSSSKYYFVRDNGLAIVQGEEGVLGEDIVSGLVGYWKFDEAGITVPTDKAYDASSNNNKGTLTNSPTRLSGSSCKAGNCLGLDGSSNYVTIPNSSSLNNNSVTVSLWFTLTSDPECNANNNWRSLIRKTSSLSSTTTGWDVVLEENKSVQFDVGLAGTTSRSGSINVGMVVNTPILLIFIYDATTGEQKIYANGVLKSTKTNTPTSIGTNSNSLDISRGTNASCPNGNGYSPGNYDDVRIYNRALSAAEVAQLYTSKIYNRSFSVENVNRDDLGRGNIVTSGGTEDPSTQKVVATVTPAGGTALTATEYLIRSKNSTTLWTDWSGGVDNSGVYTSPTNKYSSSSNIDFGTTGEIKLSGGGSPPPPPPPSPPPLTSVQVLVVAGGGGGGAGCYGGAGGAGGLIYNPSYSVTGGTSYTVTIGNGGGGSSSTNSNGVNGQNSVFGTITSTGGGGGGSRNTGTGNTGGSGGGAAFSGGTAGAGTSGQGNAGGGGYGGAGGGAGAVGGTGGGVSPYGGIGGDGLSNSLSGVSTFYAGGGGGGAGGTAGNRRAGGQGGGGSGGVTDSSPTNGTANTGGGGGGGGINSSGATQCTGSNSEIGASGGSGIVIVSYPGNQAATGGTITSSGGNTIHTFTSSGTFTTN